MDHCTPMLLCFFIPMFFHLVLCFHRQLSKTNFSNIRDFRSFLQSLLATFKEFKMHEQIENECIMDLLQQRSQTVYHVHADNKLSEMLTLFEKGLRSVKVRVCAGFHMTQTLVITDVRDI